MKNTTKVMMLAAVMVFGTAAFAGPRHQPKRDGLDLAAGIVHLVCQVINPQPTTQVIVTRPAPPPVKRYYRPAPPPPPVKQHHRRPAPPRHRR